MTGYLSDNAKRQHQVFCFNWNFKLGDITPDQAASTDLTEFRKVKLPHDWSIEYPFDENASTCGSGGYVTAGIGVYKKIFRIDQGVKAKRIHLLFDGVYMHSDVWLNGMHLGLHVYGYTPFEYDITDIVKFDEDNILTVKVNNSNQPNSRWYSGSGITRDVWIKAVSPVHIKTYGTYITTPLVNEESADVSIKTTIINKAPSKSNGILRTRIYTADGSFLGEIDKDFLVSDEQELEQLIKIDKPLLWSDISPNLYKAVTLLLIDDEIIDEYETSFGIRSILFDSNEGFILNGKRVKINGFCIHHDGGCVGAAVPRKIWERRLKLMKKMGANGVRCSHNPPDPALLDLCDELGFLVMDEAFDEWKALKQKEFGSNTHESRGYSEWFDKYHEEDLLAMLYRDRNHPSIIIWSIGNEVPEQIQKDGYLIARRLKEICHRIDPTRPIIQANDNIVSEPHEATKEFLNELDIVGYNYVARWRERAETLYDDDKRANPDWCVMGSENTTPGGVRGRYYIDEADNSSIRYKQPYYAAPVRVGKLLKFTMTHNYVAGDYMWTGIDYLGEAHWPSRSSSSGVVDTCGFPKDSYYFYQSVWRRDIPVIYAYPHWNINVEQGRIIPVICFTNCEYAELFLNGKSYGRKAYTYPDYGMTEQYAHFDKKPRNANTDDLFLCWDVPYVPGKVEVVGYNDETKVCRYVMKTAGLPAKLEAFTDDHVIIADGRDVSQITIRILDADNNFVSNADDIILNLDIDGPAELIGVDNGRPDSIESFKACKIKTFSGMAFAILQSSFEKGSIKLTISANGLLPVVVSIEAVC